MAKGQENSYPYSPFAIRFHVDFREDPDLILRIRSEAITQIPHSNVIGYKIQFWFRIA